MQASQQALPTILTMNGGPLPTCAPPDVAVGKWVTPESMWARAQTCPAHSCVQTWSPNRAFVSTPDNPFQYFSVSIKACQGGMSL